VGNALGQVRDELGGVLRLGGRIHGFACQSASAGWWASAGWSGSASASRSSCAVALARREPCWKLARRRWPARADSGDGAGGVPRSPAVPVTELAREIRRGSSGGSWPLAGAGPFGGGAGAGAGAGPFGGGAGAGAGVGPVAGSWRLAWAYADWTESK